jgi:hypothetical protein
MKNVRPEVTGRGPAEASHADALPQSEASVDDDEDDDHFDADTLPEFCRRHRFSLSFYYKLKAQGLTPDELRLGTRVLITREAQRRWRREREAASPA